MEHTRDDLARPKRNWLGPETESTTVRHTRVCQKDCTTKEQMKK